MKILYLWVLIVAVSAQPTVEKLMDLYSSTQGINWVNSTGWGQDEDYCTWHGVYCADGELEALILPNNNLHGYLPDSLPELDFFKIDLHGNGLIETIPDFMNADLEYLDLSGNYLEGKIPDSFRFLSALKYIDLSDNNLVGEIPAWIASSSTTFIHLADNAFEGPLPVFKNISHLGIPDIDLSNNKLTGSILDSFAELSYVRLNISHNQLDGTITNIKIHAKSCDFSDNLFSCPIPAWSRSLCGATCSN